MGLKRTTHLITGIAAGSVVCSFVQGEYPVHMAVGAAFGLAPDLDLLLIGLGRRIHRSPASHSLLSSVLMSVVWALSLLLLRGQSSSSLLSGVPLESTSLVVFLASFSHAATDSLTLYGTRLLFPLSRRTYRGPVRYDDHVANLTVCALAVLLIILSVEFDLSSLLV